MKNLLITLIALMISISVSHAETYSLEEYLEPEFGNLVGENKGEYFELLSSAFGGGSADFDFERITGEDISISAITFYMAKKHNHINGIEIEYSNGEKDAHGSKNGNKNRQVISDGDHINNFKVSAKDCATNNSKVTRARFMTVNGNTLWYGRNRNYGCGEVDNKGDAYKLVGLYGHHENGKLYGLGPIWMRNYDFEADAVVVTGQSPLSDSVTNGNLVEAMVKSQTTYTYNHNSRWAQQEVSIDHYNEDGVSNTWENSSEKSRTLAYTLGLEFTYGNAVFSGEFSEEAVDTETHTFGEEESEMSSVNLGVTTTVDVAPNSLHITYVRTSTSNVSQDYSLFYTDNNSCDSDGDHCDRVVFHGSISESEHTNPQIISKRAAGFVGMVAYIDESRLTDEELENVQDNVISNGYTAEVVNCLDIETPVGCEGA